MKRNLKALGLALLAAFAMSAVAASAAGAQPAQFTSFQYPTVVTGTEEGPTGHNYWEFTPGQQKHCASVTYEATLVGPSPELTVTPHYTNCETTPQGIAHTVDLNGCHYKFTAGTIKVGGSTGSIHLVCPTGGEITTTFATCVIHVPPQTLGGNPGEVTFTNKPGGTITVDIDITGKITATETDGFLCPFNGNTHVTTGSWFSTITLQGFQDLGIHHTTTNGHTLATGTEGAVVPIDVG